MIAGQLRHRLSIQGVEKSLDDYGDPSHSWSTTASVWGSIETVGGTEKDISSELVGVVTHKIKVRYISSISPNNQILFDSRTFQIESVNNWQQRNIYLELLCKEVV